ncbi:hypothetical protein KKD84_04360 [Patescibacteria group bacterium]|nr:hypothetical protein [Patescibacteria group bacterium]
MSKNEKIILAACAVLVIAAAGVSAGKYYFSHRVLMPKQGGEYIEGLVGAPQFINPLYAPSNDVDMDLTGLIYSGLLKIDADGQIQPDLAESYEISEDGKVYIFYIKGDARWHDGLEVTANDVVYTFDCILNPDYASPLIVSLRGTYVEAIDDLTVKFTLEEPFAPFLSTLTVGILPQHLWQDIPASSFQLAEFNRKPIGSGYYKFKSFIKDKKGAIHAYNLERNDRYYGQLPYIDNITFKFYPTFEEGIAALNNKNIQGLSYLPKDLKDQIRGRGDLAFYNPRLTQYTALFFNQKKRAELKNLNYRKVLALATNKEELVNDVLGGEGSVVHAPILEGLVGWHSDIAKYEYNLDEANKILDEEDDWKYLSDGDTFRAKMVKKENEDGEEVEERQDFTLNISTIDTEENVAVAEKLRDQWERVGIKVEIFTYNRLDLQKNIIKNYDYEILLYGEILGHDPDPYPFWHSAQIAQGLNLAQLADRDVDKLLEEARSTTNGEERQEKYVEFQNILAENLAAIFLYAPTYTYPVSEKVKGIEFARIVLPVDRFSGLQNWYIKTKRAWK